MLAGLSKSIVRWQIEKKIIGEEERETYQYAYEVLLNQAINLLIAILIAVILHSPVVVFLFLASYIPLRSYCGGYHADTHLGCTVVSTLLIIFVCYVIYLKNGWLLTYYPAAFLVSAWFVIRYAPVPDRHKPLDGPETVRYRKRSRIIWGLEAVCAMILYFVKAPYGLVIAVSQLILSLMLFLGILKNRKYHVV